MGKSSLLDDRLCFCGSNKKLENCCSPIISGERKAVTAEALMRSRYTAYVLENTEYLLDSWHPETRPETLSIQPGIINWLGLSIKYLKNGNSGDIAGRVEFIAKYEQKGINGEVHENSRFIFEQGCWFYIDGDLITRKAGRNDPCPCGSGKKYKKCCRGN